MRPQHKACHRNTDDQKVWLDFAVPRINLYHGAAAIASLQAIAYSGLSKSAIDFARDTEKFRSLSEPPEQVRNYIEMRRLMHELQTDSAKAAVDAAALIYAHAILDAVILKVCSLSVSLDANAWTTEIQRKQISFSDVKSSPLEEVQQRLLKEYLSRIEEQSLLYKCDTLFRVLKPRSVRGILKKYKYSRARLASLDQLRHDLVHKLMFHRKFTQMKAKVDYLINTGHFFVNLLSEHHGLPACANSGKKERRAAN